MSFNPPLKDWKGRSVWIIGASSGIGAALARQLDALGARVIVSARNADELSSFVQQHPNARGLPLDVTQPASIKAAVEHLQTDDLPDVVCYCAGHYHEVRATQYDLQEMVRHQQVNVMGFLYVLAEVLPWIVQRGHGHISVISSVAGFRGLPKSLAYGPTKAALINLAEALYIDLRPKGIGVSLITPGFVKTPLTDQNDFKMPFLITPDEAAQSIIQDWRDGVFHIHFPKRFTHFMKLLRLLPYRLYFWLIRRGTGL